MKTVTLAKKKEKLPLSHHPWVFSGAIAEKGEAAPGEIVRVVTSEDKFIAYGHLGSRAQVAMHLLEWDERAVVDGAWFTKKIHDAVARRTPLRERADTDAVRLIYSESDLLPGLIVDQYTDVLVVMILTPGMDALRQVIIDALISAVSPKAIYERSDAHAAKAEGMTAHEGLLYGALPPEIVIHENGRKFICDVAEGQKTGFFLDQRENRRIAASFTQGRTLDCFCYTGGFSMSMASRAASMTVVDSSAAALDILKKNAGLNGLSLPDENIITANAFEYLRGVKKDSFDTIVLDPPKLAPSRSAVPKALRAYKDVNLSAMKCLSPGGMLITFSCSGGVSREEFRTVISWAAKDAHREVQFIHALSQAEDHPVRASFPESEYLTGEVCRVI
ncbi:MAG: class I SAM-dependent rRNA methyltransferase [Spirochaetota bacterium]